MLARPRPVTPHYAEFSAAFESFGRLPVTRRLARLTPAPTGAPVPAGTPTAGAAR